MTSNHDSPAPASQANAAASLAIVTGASRGLGEALAAEFLRAGTALITLARGRSGTLDALAQQHGTPLTQLQADLSTAQGAQHAGEQLAQLIPPALSRCILINNAGTVEPISNSERLGNATAISSAFTLNVTSLMVLTAAVLRAAATTDCRILNISSGAGRNPMPGWGVYCATKAAVDMYTRVLTQEHPNVRAAALAPGVVDTQMQHVIRSSDARDFPNLARFRGLHEHGQLASPADTARLILQYISRDDFGTTVLDDIRNYS